MVEGQANQAMATCYGDADCDGVVDAADNCAQYFNPAQEDVDYQGIAGAFSFEGVPGHFVVKDSSANGDGRTVNTNITRDGRFGSGMTTQVLGNPNYVKVPNNAALQSVSGTALTLAAWVRPRNDNTKAIMGKAGQFSFMWYGPESARFLMFFGAQKYFHFAGPVTMPDNVWTHVALTYDGEFVRYYVNGQLVGSVAETGNVAATTYALLIGCSPALNSDECNTPAYQDLDEVGLWPRVLSDAELQAL